MVVETFNQIFLMENGSLMVPIELLHQGQISPYMVRHFLSLLLRENLTATHIDGLSFIRLTPQNRLVSELILQELNSNLFELDDIELAVKICVDESVPLFLGHSIDLDPNQTEWGNELAVAGR